MRRTRISRGLIGALVAVIALGLVFYFHNTSKSKASANPAIAITPPAPIQPEKKEPLVVTAPPTAAPTTAPATQPATPLIEKPLAPQQPPIVSSTPTVSVPFTSPSAPRASSSADPLGAGKSLMDTGDLLNARRTINDALVAGKLSESDAATAKQMLSQINQTVVFSPKRFADDEFGGTYSVQSGDLMKKIATAHDVTVDLLCRLNNISDPRKLRAGATLKVLKGPFHAVVTKHNFTLEIWLGEPYSAGSVYVTTFPVGLGRDDSTPAGKWQVKPESKLKNPAYYSPRGEGVIASGDPKNPLGQYWIGLTGIDGHALGKMSYGIHGTIEPDSIGKQASMGCIRMRNEDVAQVFELLIESKSTVTVRD